MDFDLGSSDSIQQFLSVLGERLHDAYIENVGTFLPCGRKKVEFVIKDEGRFGIGSDNIGTVFIDTGFLIGTVSAISHALYAEGRVDGFKACCLPEDASGIRIDAADRNLVLSLAVSTVAYVIMHDLGHIYLEGDEETKEIQADILSATVISCLAGRSFEGFEAYFTPFCGMSPILFWDIGQLVYGKNPFEDCMERKHVLLEKLKNLIQGLPGESRSVYSDIEQRFLLVNGMI